jgi:hypothetical protein
MGVFLLLDLEDRLGDPRSARPGSTSPRSPEPLSPSRPLRGYDPFRLILNADHMKRPRPRPILAPHDPHRSRRPLRGGREAGLDRCGRARRRDLVGSGRNVAFVPPGEMNRAPKRHYVGLPYPRLCWADVRANLGGTIDAGHVFEKARGQKRAGSERGVRQQSRSGDDDECAM